MKVLGFIINPSALLRRLSWEKVHSPFYFFSVAYEKRSMKNSTHALRPYFCLYFSAMEDDTLSHRAKYNEEGLFGVLYDL